MSFSFKVTLRPARPRRLEAARDPLAEPPEDRLEILEADERSVSKVVSAEMLFVSRSGVTRRCILAPGEAGQALRVAAERLEQASGRAPRADGAIRVTPALASRACAAAPMPGMIETGLSARNSAASASADDREAARLLEIGGDLGEELVVGQARPRP